MGWEKVPLCDYCDEMIGSGESFVDASAVGPPGDLLIHDACFSEDLSAEDFIKLAGLNSVVRIMPDGTKKPVV